MGERDAFGRETGEDALADMGWKGPERPKWETAAPRPQSAETTLTAGNPVVTPPPPVPRPARPPRVVRRRRRGMSRLISLVAVLVVLGAGASSLVRLGGDVVDRGV